MARNPRKPIEIGWCELLDLPELGISKIHAKIDTGANTSSLHAVKIKHFDRDDEAWVTFKIPKSPDQPSHECEAKVIARRNIKSSNGQMQERTVIETAMRLGSFEWKGQMTLANRQSMAFPILIGRRALRRGFLVNSAKRWMLGR